MTSKIDSQIRDRIDTFIRELEQLVRRAALEAVAETLGGTPAPARGGARRRVGRPAKRVAKKAAKRAGKKAAKRGSARGGKAVAPEAIVSALRQHGEMNIGDLGRSLGVTTARLKDPLAEMMEAGQIGKKGKARGTKYNAK